MLRLEEADEPALSQETPWQLHSVPYSTTTAAAPVHPVLRVLSRGSEWGVEHEVGTAGLGGGSSDEEQLLALALIAARTVAMDPPSSPCARGISPVAPDNIWLREVHPMARGTTEYRVPARASLSPATTNMPAR